MRRRVLQKYLYNFSTPPGEPERLLEVLDVARQGKAAGVWTLEKWGDYFMHPEERREILNVISLEFSKTPLAKKVGALSLLALEGGRGGGGGMCV